MAHALLWGTLSFLLAVACGGPLILLRHYGVGKTIRIDGPATHQVKMGTPTMGGLMIVVPVLVITLLTNLAGRYSILVPLGVMAAYALLGMYDDLRGVRDHTGVGMLARLKFPWQVSIGLLSALGLRYVLDLGGMAVPTFPREFDIGWWYLPIATLLIVAEANAVNLTDGLDGLAGGTSAVAYMAYGVIAYLQGQVYLVTFCFTVVGAILAFLWYNAYPAELFMGDVGSMALGATLATVALQVGYFRLSGGKRLFKMAPLHHHFELLGWSEVQIMQRFWLIAMLSGMLGVALALL
jgi:phospho-N-acetylmuramoyl-pentapeptide-transferase